MPFPPFSAIRRVLVGIFMLSGWALAVALGWRLRETAPRPEPPELRVSEVAPAEKVERIFREWLGHPSVAGAAIGFCVLEENGQTVFASPLAKTALCPASSLKTVTTGAAFSLLGPDFRFETTLSAISSVGTDGTVNGDLVLVGGGDPTLSQDDLSKLAGAVVAAGLKKVTGQLLVDASIFPPEAVSEHWNWGDIGNAYGAGAFGLNLDHNRLEIRFAPASQPGAPAKFLGGSPAPRETRWVNHVVTGPAGSGDQVVVYSAPYGRTITLRGSVPTGEDVFTVRGAIPDPPALATELLHARLTGAGVVFGHQPGSAATGTRAVLTTHRSAPLAEIVDHLHEVSDNLEAQCLFLTMGRRQNADPADTLRQHWETAGVEFIGLRLLDGSGLARANMIRPLDLARVNFAARHGAHGQRFHDSLTVYAGGKIRGKIGGMSGVKTQVGFLRASSGRELTFAVMANGLPAGKTYWALQQELLEKVGAEL